jgi:DNA polymerase-3 subunit gamma/tau
MKWNEVLHRVKEARITVHAWLVDGEPVAATDSTILVAFKNTMHRETTERPAHREIIERVMQDVFGNPVKLATCMLKEWQNAAERSGEQQGETLELQPDAIDTGEEQRPQWVEEAVKLFGEDLVVIKEDN